MGLRDMRAAAADSQRYETRVNKGSINMAVWQQELNQMWQQGYRVHTVFEQGGNTITLFEKRD